LVDSIEYVKMHGATNPKPFFVCFGPVHRPGICKKVVSVHAMKLLNGSGVTAPFILNVDTG
jgi:hypothetical protein